MLVQDVGLRGHFVSVGVARFAVHNPPERE
jgi:hypothetical protein